MKNGDLNVSKKYISPGGRRTRHWIDKQKSAYEKGSLNAEQINKLRSIKALSQSIKQEAKT